MASEKKDAADNTRDERGRFIAGNPGGPGGARRKTAAFRRAADEALTDEHVQAIMRRAARMALEGNLGAMRFVIERACGRPTNTPADPEPLDLVVPELKTAGDCNNAVQSLLDSVCAGKIDHDSAKLLITAVQTRLKAIEITDLEERLQRIEQTAELHRR